MTDNAMTTAEQATANLYKEVEPAALQEFLEELFIESLVEDDSLSIPAKRNRHACYQALQHFIKQTCHYHGRASEDH